MRKKRNNTITPNKQRDKQKKINNEAAGTDAARREAVAKSRCRHRRSSDKSTNSNNKDNGRMGYSETAGVGGGAL